jgi:hypothetical protein
MKRHMTVLALATIAACHAQAQSFFEIEAGIGGSSYVKTGNNVYYDEGFAHSTPIAAPAGRVGIMADFYNPSGLIPGLRAHATYYNFGAVTWHATVPEDGFTRNGVSGGYNASTDSCTNNNCGTFRNFSSSGLTQAVALTVEPYWDIGHGYTLGLEAGPAMYRAEWNTQATALSDGSFGPAGTVQDISVKAKWQLSYILGLSLSRGPVSLRLNYLSTRRAGNQNPVGTKGVFMGTFNYTFY